MLASKKKSDNTKDENYFAHSYLIMDESRSQKKRSVAGFRHLLDKMLYKRSYRGWPTATCWPNLAFLAGIGEAMQQVEPSKKVPSS